MENNAIRQSIAGPWAVIRRVCRLLPRCCRMTLDRS